MAFNGCYSEIILEVSGCEAKSQERVRKVLPVGWR